MDYFDGGLFNEINPVDLHPEELRLLRGASNANWSEIRPAIFGTIFEDSMEKTERHQIGAHFTSELDIKRIVDPVIVEPWDLRIEAARSADDLRALHAELCAYQVLDPACGSGNFLYIAYREMKKLERRILDRLADWEGGEPQVEQFVTARQFWGFDVKDFAVELAKVTLMIAKKLAVDELHIAENPLPLDNLDDQIRCADALFADWPEFDACIGNPPYMGAKVLKQEHSPDYINRVRDVFPGGAGQRGLLRVLVPQGARPDETGRAGRAGRHEHDPAELHAHRRIGLYRRQRRADLRRGVVDALVGRSGGACVDCLLEQGRAACAPFAPPALLHRQSEPPKRNAGGSWRCP